MILKCLQAESTEQEASAWKGAAGGSLRKDLLVEAASFPDIPKQRQKLAVGPPPGTHMQLPLPGKGVRILRSSQPAVLEQE